MDHCENKRHLIPALVTVMHVLDDCYLALPAPYVQMQKNIQGDQGEVATPLGHRCARQWSCQAKPPQACRV